MDAVLTKRLLVGSSYWLLALSAYSISPCALGQSPPTNEAEEIIRLDALAVEERGLGRPYLLVEIPGYEILSPFSMRDTRAYAEEFQRQKALVSMVMPETLHAACQVPIALVLDDQPPARNDSEVSIGNLAPGLSGILRQSIDAIRGVPPRWSKSATKQRESAISWSRSNSSDSVVIYSSIFRAHDYIRQSGTGRIGGVNSWLSWVFPIPSLFQHHIPPWPDWLMIGVGGIRARCFGSNAIQFFAPTVTIDPPGRFPFDLVLGVRSAGEESQDHSELRRQASLVLVSWGIFDEDTRRETFWRFARMCSQRTIATDDFTRMFGTEAELQLLRFWGKCVRSNGRNVLATYVPEKPIPTAQVKIRAADRAILARIKSEYELNIARLVEHLSPELSRQCRDQAGRRLRAAYARGIREPHFLATLALHCCETSTTDASDRLEEAVAAGARRPRLLYELAQQRYANLLKAKSPAELTSTDLAHVLEPLEETSRLSPQMAETYVFATELLAGHASPSPTRFLDELVLAPRYFPLDWVLALKVATLLDRFQRPEALQIVEQGISVADLDSSTGAALVRLRAEITSRSPARSQSGR